MAVAVLLLAGCQTGTQKLSGNAVNEMVSVLLVPDTDLNLYLYARQDRPTTVPADLMGLDYDLDVESMAIWGSSDDSQEAMAVAVTLVTDGEAEKVYNEIVAGPSTWKLLRGKKLYLVQGDGDAADSLREAIEANRFSYFKDEEVLDVVSALPNGERTRLVTISVLKNDPILLDSLLQDRSDVDVAGINQLMESARVNLVVGGLYTPNRINIARASELIRSEDLAALDAGILLLVKSDLPGFVVGPIVSNYLTSYGFNQYNVGDVTLYKGRGVGIGGDELQTIVRIENNFLFASMSGQESYAETLIMSIYR